MHASHLVTCCAVQYTEDATSQASRAIADYYGIGGRAIGARGAVTNWKAAEHMWSAAVGQAIDAAHFDFTLLPSDEPEHLFRVDNLMMEPADRMKCTEIAFESGACSRLYMAPDATAALSAVVPPSLQLALWLMCSVLVGAGWWDCARNGPLNNQLCWCC